MWRFGLIVAGAMVAGCTVGPNYQGPPAVEIPAQFSEATTRPASRPAEVDLAVWWKTFNDPALDGLIDRAVAANHDLRIAEARVREARALRRVTASDRYPSVDGTGSYRRTRTSENVEGSGGTGGVPAPGSSAGVSGSGFSFERDQDLYQAGFDAAWEIDVFGRVRRSVEAADADVSSAIEGQRDALVTLLAEVARNYVELRGLQKQLAVARSNITAQQDTADLTASRVRAGLERESNLRRAEGLVASTKAAVPALEAGIRRTIHRLGVLTGNEPGALVEELIGQKAIPTAAPDVPLGLPVDLLRQRPDVRRAERELAAASARIGAATADLYPQFTLTGSLGLESSKLSNLVGGDSVFWSAGPGVRWPLLEWGRIRGNIQAADARTTQAAERYQQTVLIALEDVENALVNLNREQERRTALEQAVAANRDAVDLATKRQERGVATFLEVLDAQRALYLVEDQLAQSEQAVSADIVALYKSLGGGWSAGRE